MQKRYEAMFIFPSTLKEEALDKALERVRADVTRSNGTVAEAKVLGTRHFARPMKKQEAGLYVMMVLDMDPKDMKTLNERLRLNEEIFRVQMVIQEEVPAAAPAAVAAAGDAVAGGASKDAAPAPAGE